MEFFWCFYSNQCGDIFRNRADYQKENEVEKHEFGKERDCMKKMILGIVWQLMGFLGSIIILCSVAPHEWDYNGITGILGSLLGLGLIIPLIVCIIFFICGVVVCFKAIGEK